MRAYAVERFGSPPAILDLTSPTAHDGYVVRVTYAGVNPLDYKLVDSLTPQSSYPFVLGIDFAGVLQHAPSAERELRAGDRVFGIARTHGSYAEYTAVPADGKAEALGRIPEPIADDQAAALPIAGITALGAVDFTRVAAGQSLVVMGATGGVGGYARRDAEILKADGRLVSTLYAADIPWFAERDITAENIASVENPLASRGGLTELARFIAAGAISARITTTESLANAGALLDRLRHGGVHGKAVIRM